MASVTFDNGAVWDNLLTDKYSTKVTGHGSRGRIQGYAQGGRLRGLETVGKPLKIVTGTIQYDSSYPTGGEDISAIDIDGFSNGARVGIIFEQPNVAAARTVAVAGTGATMKLLAYTDGFVTQVTAATNLSAVAAIRFIAWGY